MSNYGTPYDDSFRTLLTDCKRLVIPLVNEMFGKNGRKRSMWSCIKMKYLLQLELIKNE